MFAMQLHRAAMCNYRPPCTPSCSYSVPSPQRQHPSRSSARRGQLHASVASGERVQTEAERTQQVLQEVTKRIKVLGAQGRTREAIEELAGLAKVGVQPDALAATALVKACCRDMSLAQSVFDEMFGDFLSPDEISFVVLLRGYGSRSPPDWPRMDSTLTVMETKFGLAPTAMSFNALLEVCCRTNDLDRGQDVIDRMVSNGVEPDEFTEDIVARKRALRAYLRKMAL